MIIGEGLSLAGRVAVTGAAGGLGTAICSELSYRGASVVGVDVCPGTDLQLDLATDEGNQAMVEATLEMYVG